MNTPGLRRTTIFLLALVVVGLGASACLLKLPPILLWHGSRYAGPSVYGGWFTRDPLIIAFPWALVFIAAFFDWRKPWQLGHLDLLALVSFWFVAMLISAHDY